MGRRTDPEVVRGRASEMLSEIGIPEMVDDVCDLYYRMYSAGLAAGGRSVHDCLVVCIHLTSLKMADPLSFKEIIDRVGWSVCTNRGLRHIAAEVVEVFGDFDISAPNRGPEMIIPVMVQFFETGDAATELEKKLQSMWKKVVTNAEKVGFITTGVRQVGWVAAMVYLALKPFGRVSMQSVADLCGISITSVRLRVKEARRML